MPSSLLILGVVFLLLAVNVRRPLRRPSVIATASFFAGWLVGELAIHHVVAQGLVVAGLIAGGALSAWPGWLGLLLSLVAWTLLLDSYGRAGETGRRIEAALREALGEGYDEVIAPATRADLDRGPDWGAILAPFPIRRPGIERLGDVVYHEEGRVRLRLDVYRRAPGREAAAATSLAGRNAASPALLYVHGGAWVFGRKDEQGLPLLHHFAALGWTCFTIDYRLSPRATFPDQLVDVKRAIRWVREHAAAHGADPRFLVVAGNSAGGHLAALAALTAGDPVYQPGFESDDTRVEGCVSFYGVYDLVDRHRCYAHDGLTELIERRVLKVKLAEARACWEAASPIARIGPDAPPFLLLHGDHDSLVPVAQARHFVAAFREAARAPIACAVLPGAQHAFEVFPSLRAELAVRGAARYCAWLHARHLARRAGEAASASG